MEGYIKLHRKLMEWCWYKKSEVVHFFITLLLMANHKESRWQNIIIQRGQLITGRKSLSEITGLSERSVRTCIKRLKSTNEIAVKTTNRYSIITICNYDKYNNARTHNDQHNDQQTDQQVTSKRPASDQQVTTNKNVKNVKNDKNIFSEKTNLLFKRFLEEKKIISETRIDSLVTFLKILSHGNDNFAQAIINRAIAGGYESFVALTTKEEEQLRSNNYSSIGIDKNPSLDDFIQFFEENKQPRELAERVFDDFEYNKHWQDKNGNSFANNWREIVKINLFEKGNVTV